MVLIEPGVVIVGNPYTDEILTAVQRAYGEIGLHVSLTSGLDGDHTTPYTLHHQGRALDVRRWGVKNVDALAARLRALLPKFYDVVVEKTHIHIEADIKKELAK